jgi:hypothetical protein
MNPLCGAWLQPARSLTASQITGVIRVKKGAVSLGYLELQMIKNSFVELD